MSTESILILVHKVDKTPYTYEDEFGFTNYVIVNHVSFVDKFYKIHGKDYAPDYEFVKSQIVIPS